MAGYRSAFVRTHAGCRIDLGSRVPESDGLPLRSLDLLMTAAQPRRPARGRQSIVFPLRGPGGEPIDLWRTLISHGMAELPPMRTNEQDRSMTVTVPVRGGRPRIVRVLARDEVGVVEIIGPRTSQATTTSIATALRHLLRLDEDLSTFYRMVRDDPALGWAAQGAGRMLRSATVFEDVVKTICTTNTTWAGT